MVGPDHLSDALAEHLPGDRHPVLVGGLLPDRAVRGLDGGGGGGGRVAFAVGAHDGLLLSS